MGLNEFILNRAIYNNFAISGLFEGDIELNPEQESNVWYKIFWINLPNEVADSS